MEADEKKCPECAEAIKADAVICRYCRAEQPVIGSNKKAAQKRASNKALGCFVAAGIGTAFFVGVIQLTQPGTRLASSPLGVDAQMQSIHDKVADDAEKQYDIAASGGTAMDRCVQAGMVAAAYLQAQKQELYGTWKMTEKADCATAGISK